MSVLLDGDYESHFSKEILNSVMNKIFVVNDINKFIGTKVKSNSGIEYTVDECHVMIGRINSPWLEGSIINHKHFFQGNVRVMIRIYNESRKYCVDGGIRQCLEGINPFPKGKCDYDICFRPYDIPVNHPDWKKSWEDIDFLIMLKHPENKKIKVSF